MTKSQRIQHKIGNQQRKSRIQALLNHADADVRKFYNVLGGFQNGKHTPKD